jgi:uncharacterized cupin superfamily protein
MKRITPLVHTWSEYSAAERLDHNAYFVQRAAGEPGVVVDPVALRAGDEDELKELGGVEAVVLTGGHEGRETQATWFQRELGCAVHGLHEFKEGETLPGGLSPSQLADGEVALFHRAGRAWLVGDRVVGAPAGELSLPAALAGDEAGRARAARSLRSLLAVIFERVLVARGMPVLREAPRAIQDLVFAHDPEACVVRQEEVSFIPGLQHGESYGRRGAEYARLLGLKTLDFDLQEALPGRRSTAVHRHDGDEELFLIVSGEGEVHILRSGESELRRIPVKAGDVVAFPPRYQIAHSFKCTGSEPLRFFAFAAPGEESVGVVDYPLSGKRLTYAWPPGKLSRYFLPERRDVPYFESEPEA